MSTKFSQKLTSKLSLWLIPLTIALLLGACAAPVAAPASSSAGEASDSTAASGDSDHVEEAHAEEEHATEEHATEEHAHVEEMPTLSAADLADGRLLSVVATNNIVADMVAQVGGDHIELSQLIPTGADPHSFEPAPRDVVVLNEADVIFMNGLGLEETLEPIFESLDRDVPIVSVNIGVETVEFDAEHAEGEHAEEEHAEEEHAGEEHAEEEHAEEEHGHAHEGADPHTWFDVQNVQTWVHNIEHALSGLDPAHAAEYEAAAEAYHAELAQLDAEIREKVAEIPSEQRKLVTDHDTFHYFADAYGFDVVGTVIPSISTLAAPSAQQLAALQSQIEEADVPAIFVGTTVSPDVAEQLASDLGIQVVPIYTGSLSEEGGPADNYVAFMRYNVDAIVDALR